MQRKSSAKSIIILIVVVVLGACGYFYFTGTPTDTSSLLSNGDAQTTAVSVEAQKIVTLLNQTTSLHIDTSLFKSPLYLSLVDHTVQVVEQPVGKPNPFYYTVSAPAGTPTKGK